MYKLTLRCVKSEDLEVIDMMTKERNIKVQPLNSDNTVIVLKGDIRALTWAQQIANDCMDCIVPAISR